MRLIHQANGSWAVTEMASTDLARIQLALVLADQPALSSHTTTGWQCPLTDSFPRHMAGVLAGVLDGCTCRPAPVRPAWIYGPSAQVTWEPGTRHFA